MMRWMVSSLLMGVLIGSSAGATEKISDAPVQPNPSPLPASAPVGGKDEALLRQRIADRWQALVKGDFEAAYQFETPAYRAIYTPVQFRYQFGNQALWRMASVKEIHYDGPTVARVWVDVDYRYAEPGMKKDQRMLNMTHGINEVWLYKDGQWWRQQE